MKRRVDHVEANGGAPLYLKEKEVADILMVSVKTIQNWRWRGLPPAYTKINGIVRYRYADIIALAGGTDAE